MIIFDIIYSIYTYCSIGTFMVLYLYLMDHMFGFKRQLPRPLYYLLTFVISIILYRAPQYLIYKTDSLPYFYSFIVLLIVGVLVTLFCIKGKIESKLHYFFLYFASYKCMVFTCGFLYSHEKIWNPILYKCLDLTTHILMLILICFEMHLFINHPIKFQVKLSRSQNILIYLCPISFIVLLQLADPSVELNTDLYMSFAAAILLMNLLIFYYLYISLGEAFDSKHELGRALTETHAQLTRYRYTVFMEEQARKERHEIKNNYFYIQTLLRENKYDQIDSFLTTHLGEFSDQTFSVMSGNMLIDYIINTKLEEARKHDIATYTEILIPENLTINEEYFCTILLNLLDNAIEASINEKNPDIQIQISIKNQYLSCNVKNKVSHNVLVENPSFTTTKPDKAKHGLGMRIIHDRVRRMNGIIDISMDSNYFVASVMIPINEQ